MAHTMPIGTSASTILFIHITHHHSYHMYMVNSTDAEKREVSMILIKLFFFEDLGVHWRALVQSNK